MLIQRYIQRALEALYVVDCKYSFFSNYDLRQLKSIFFHGDRENYEIRLHHQINMSNYWLQLDCGTRISSLECYFLDWYESYRYRVEVIEDCLSKIEATVRENLPDRPENSFPSAIFIERPTEAGVVVRVILRRLHAQIPDLCHKHPADRLIESKEPLLRVISDIKKDVERDKKVRAIDATARMGMFTGLKKLDRQMTRTSFYRLARNAAMFLTAYYVLRRFDLIKAMPFLPSAPNVGALG